MSSEPLASWTIARAISIVPRRPGVFGSSSSSFWIGAATATVVAIFTSVWLEGAQPITPRESTFLLFYLKFVVVCCLCVALFIKNHTKIFVRS